jgi:hypothetical protein|tara:strand:+ start:492 stop:863 length:372 start_codon:yes stop_codon:yes gene_type:complete
MVDPSRIKLVLTRDGDNVITDLQEAVDKESGVRQAYVMTIPYKVVITEEPQQQTDLETFEDQEIKVRYTPWNPFTIDQKIAVTPDYIITVMEPAPSILQTYLANVNKRTGDQYVEEAIQPEVV